MITDNFIYRHNGPRKNEVKEMLSYIGADSIEQLISETIPARIRLKEGMDLPDGINEYEYLQHLKELAAKNKLYRSYIGLGYYNTITPGVIQRNVLENPGWYTSYTPYQAEISQGRLEALLNYQTMVSDLTGFPLANASLLDEATAAAEAMIMMYNSRSREQVKNNVRKFFISEDIFPQSIAVIETRALPLGIELVRGDHRAFEWNGSFFAGIVQYPDQAGSICDFAEFAARAKEAGAAVIAAADLMSLTLLKSPAEWGAEVAIGSTQRFGIPMGYGGPHAAYLATVDKYKRNIPGRIIGISKDARGNLALRMALQTREQHIKRERATSNICTAQALLASMAGMYATYHGAAGLKKIALDIHTNACRLASTFGKMGLRQVNESFFDTLQVEFGSEEQVEKLRRNALKEGMNFRYIDAITVGISLDETTGEKDLSDIVQVFAKTLGKEVSLAAGTGHCLPERLLRTSPYLTAEVFNKYHSETEMMRYLKRLENRDLALNRTMIPLGSCTMKLNAAAELFSLSWPEFNAIHPFVPDDQAEGYHELIEKLESDLCKITGYAAISLQPNSGASGEYTGLLVIREYHKHRGEGHRNVCLIPSSAHGTNPASSVMAGMEVVVVKTDLLGNIDYQDLEQKVGKHSENLAAIMVTYPSTHGVFEERIMDVIELVHRHGGQVYMDGANMNAQVGYTNPAIIGADVCHLNLHKTFAIPHGGGGPGVGPIGVAAHLAPYLPGHVMRKNSGENAITAVSAAPFGSAMILPISYGYIKLLGREGLKSATEYAILNANYIKTRLEGHYKILYTGIKGRVAHEMILDCNEFSRTANVQVVDIAKRLMDYGFHAPTVAFPVAGTLMVEPTESEPLDEMNRFCDAMISIREEIREIEEGRADKDNNPVRNAPHTVNMVVADEWNYPYDRRKAAFPVEYLTQDKYFTPVTRIDDAYGDRNLMCTCNSIEEFIVDTN